MPANFVHALAPLLQPRSIAIIGASERNAYANIAIRNLRAIGYGGTVHMVNPRGGEIFGQTAKESCAAIGELVDAAFICVPITGVVNAIEQAAEAGIYNFVVLSSGFSEVGGEGKEREDALVDLCARKGLQLLGPNCLGFVNKADGVALGSIPVLDGRNDGSLAIVSASGNIAYQLASLAGQNGIACSHLIATGNETNVTTAQCIDYLAAHPAVKSIALLLESVRDPDVFAAAAERALAARKPIVVLKVGAAPITAAVAAAHTGAVVGDDRVFDAICDRLAIVRVTTFEELIATAGAMGSIGPLENDGIAMVSISGGACEVASDLAAHYGASMPAFSDETAAELRSFISDFGQTHNPIDLTGAAVPDPTLWHKALRTVSKDSQIGLTICTFELPTESPAPQAAALEQIALGAHEAATPICLMESYNKPITPAGQAWLTESGISCVLPGIGLGIFAATKLAWWSAKLRQRTPWDRRVAPPKGTARPRSEQEALHHLAEHGVPVVPFRLAVNRVQAQSAADELGGPVVLKIASPDIAHKSDIGGVALNVSGREAVGEAYDWIEAAAKAARPDARLDGIVVSPMRAKGVEFFVGIARDPQWGLVMALGLGGLWVELMQDTVLVPLPACEGEIATAIGRLRGAKLFTGYRGTSATDLDRLATVAAAIGRAALALGPDLAAFEVNPLLVRGNDIEALDALAVWAK